MQQQGQGQFSGLTLDQTTISQIVNGLQQASLSGATQLPSRDIPMNTLDYQNDEEIHANYVPKVKLTSDYIREYEKASEESLRKHERETYREQTAKSIWNDIQIPVLIAILYFIFQMPVVTKFLYKYFSFLSIYRDDGNMNLVGLLLKSVLFGSLFLLIQKTTDFLVSL
jgi:hypothetical protein